MYVQIYGGVGAGLYELSVIVMYGLWTRPYNVVVISIVPDYFKSQIPNLKSKI